MSQMKDRIEKALENIKRISVEPDIHGSRYITLKPEYEGDALQARLEVIVAFLLSSSNVVQVTCGFQTPGMAEEEIVFRGRPMRLLQGYNAEKQETEYTLMFVNVLSGYLYEQLNPGENA